MKLPNYTLTRNGDRVTLTHVPTGKFRQFKLPSEIPFMSDVARDAVRANHLALRRIVNKEDNA